MKKGIKITVSLVAIILFFLLGYFLGSNNSSQNLNELIHQGESKNVEFFDYNWEGVSDRVTKTYLGGIEGRCSAQAERQFVQTGTRKGVMGCLVNNVEIKDEILRIQCVCLFD